jgi:hypothetical protein
MLPCLKDIHWHKWSPLSNREESVFDENSKTPGINAFIYALMISQLNVFINDITVQSGDNVIIDFAICQVLRDPRQGFSVYPKNSFYSPDKIPFAS